MPFHDLVLLYLVFIMSSSGDFYHLKHFLVNPTAARTLPGYLIIFLISCAFFVIVYELDISLFLVLSNATETLHKSCILCLQFSSVAQSCPTL